MTKKSIALFAAYVLFLVACFTVAFPSSFTVADCGSVYVDLELPCEITEVTCPLCSGSTDISPHAAKYLADPVVFFEENDGSSTFWGLKTMVGLETVTCYIEKRCITDEIAHRGFRCDAVLGCVQCNDANSVCYVVSEDTEEVLVPSERKIWKPSSED